MRTIPAAALIEALSDGGELALLDAREEGEFGARHLFWAVNCPLSAAELRLPALLPRIGVRVVCMDEDGTSDGPAARLAGVVASMGGGDVAVLAGGVAAAETAGMVAFSGVNVPSKAFGEWVEHHHGTPSVDALTLDRWLKEGAPGHPGVVVLDSRPLDEFRRMSIPGALDMPGGELVYRIGDVVCDPDTLVVVNCAGRTRSILGAESLRQAGLPNRVVALRNGTMGWELAGLRCEQGSERAHGLGRPAGAAEALARATRFAEESGIGIVGPLDLARFEDDPDRTLYVLDVRSPAEFAAGHRPGSLSAPGGQLVQATDRWIGVRNARIALIDDDGVRGRMTGGWLARMGYRDVFLVEGGLGEVLTTGAPAAAGPADGRTTAATVTPAELADRLAGDAMVLDVGRSLDFRTGHVPGAIWGIRTRLAPLRSRLAGRTVVITSADGALARLAAAEVASLGTGTVLLLAGGTTAWREAGRPLESDPADPPDEACVDCWLRPYDRNDGVEAAMQAYLDWEVDLVRRIEGDPSIRFGLPSAA